MASVAGFPPTRSFGSSPSFSSTNRSAGLASSSAASVTSQQLSAIDAELAALEQQSVRAEEAASLPKGRTTPNVAIAQRRQQEHSDNLTKLINQRLALGDGSGLSPGFPESVVTKMDSNIISTINDLNDDFIEPNLDLIYGYMATLEPESPNRAAIEARLAEIPSLAVTPQDDGFDFGGVDFSFAGDDADVWASYMPNYGVSNNYHTTGGMISSYMGSAGVRDAFATRNAYYGLSG